MNAPKPASAPKASSVEFNPIWLLLTLSLVIAILLREQRTALLIYSLSVFSLAIAAAFLLPRWLDRRERLFLRRALKHLSQADLPGLERLAAQQWALRTWGRAWVVQERLALGAAQLGQPEAAVPLYRAALEKAPRRQRAQIQLALAQLELKTPEHAQAQARLRSLLEHPVFKGRAHTLLGEHLLEQGQKSEARALLQIARDCASPQDLAQIDRLLAQSEPTQPSAP